MTVKKFLGFTGVVAAGAAYYYNAAAVNAIVAPIFTKVASVFLGMSFGVMAGFAVAGLVGFGLYKVLKAANGISEIFQKAVEAAVAEFEAERLVAQSTPVVHVAIETPRNTDTPTPITFTQESDSVLLGSASSLNLDVSPTMTEEKPAVAVAVTMFLEAPVEVSAEPVAVDSTNGVQSPAPVPQLLTSEVVKTPAVTAPAPVSMSAQAQPAALQPRVPAMPLCSIPIPQRTPFPIPQRAPFPIPLFPGLDGSDEDSADRNFGHRPRLPQQLLVIQGRPPVEKKRAQPAHQQYVAASSSVNPFPLQHLVRQRRY